MVEDAFVQRCLCLAAYLLSGSEVSSTMGVTTPLVSPIVSYHIYSP